MADDRWLTFDCYGTIADWNTCMREALEPVVGASAPALLTAYHQAELTLEAGPSWRPYREILSSGLAWAARRLQVPLDPAQAGALVEAWPRMTVFEDAGGALSALASAGWRLAILTNCDDDLFATTRPKFPVPVDIVVTAEQVRSYKPDLGHFRRFAELTGAAPVNWIHVANSWVHDILPAARMGLRSVWVDRDLTGHPAKLAERRITAMRRLPEAVADVSAVLPWPPLELRGAPGEAERLAGQRGPWQRAVRGHGEPLPHRGSLVGVEPPAVARRHELVHPPRGKLHHEVAADEHREDLPVVAQRAAPESAAAARQRHAVSVAELADQILEAFGRRQVCGHAYRVDLGRGARPALVEEDANEQRRPASRRLRADT
jgi:2-haloacid dehalogenase